MEENNTLQDQGQAMVGLHFHFNDPKEGRKTGTVVNYVNTLNGAPGHWVVFQYQDPVTRLNKQVHLSSGKWKLLKSI